MPLDSFKVEDCQEKVTSDLVERPGEQGQANDAVRKRRSSSHGRHIKKYEKRVSRGKEWERKRLLADNGRQAGLAACCAVMAYATLRGGIKLFHHARRGSLRMLLSDLCPVLAPMTYWLDFGSLLGIFRDGDLILHDNDIDIAVFEPNWPWLLLHLQKSLPKYNVRLEIPSEVPDACFMRVYCGFGFADIFGAIELHDGRLLVDCGHGETTCIDRSLVLPTTTQEWRGVSIKVPNNLEGALLSRYGPTWRVPRYMDKGADTVEANKAYARIFKAFSKIGIRL